MPHVEFRSKHLGDDPNEVRINGASVYTDGGVKVHEINVPPRELTRVTVTLPVRMLTIAAEGDL
jgi:hypothetical protein